MHTYGFVHMYGSAVLSVHELDPALTASNIDQNVRMEHISICEDCLPQICQVATLLLYVKTETPTFQYGFSMIR